MLVTPQLQPGSRGAWMVHPEAAKNIASLERDAETGVLGASCFLLFWVLGSLDLHPDHADEKVQSVCQAAALW